jgi:hypothetical protein
MGGRDVGSVWKNHYQNRLSTKYNLITRGIQLKSSLYSVRGCGNIRNVRENTIEDQNPRNLGSQPCIIKIATENIIVIQNTIYTIKYE